MRMPILLVLLAMLFPLTAIAQDNDSIVVLDQAERLADGPLFPTEDATDLGNGVSLVYAYVAYDGLSARVYGELAVALEADYAILAPSVQLTATDTNGEAIQVSFSTALAPTARNGSRVPFVIPLQTSGFLIASASVAACIDGDRVRDNIVAVSNVAPAGDGGAFGLSFDLANETEDLPVDQPRVYFAGFNGDGVIVASAAGFYVDNLRPGHSVSDSIVGATWNFASADVESDASALVYEATSYPGNLHPSTVCGDEIMTVLSDELPRPMTSATSVV